MLIYIDTDGGNYGVAEQNLVIVEATEEEVEALSEMSDSERVAWAKGK